MRAPRLTVADRADAVKAALREVLMVAVALGLDGLLRDGAGWKVRCVWHRERTGSMSLRLYDDGIGVWCFGCERGGTVLDLIAAVHGHAMTGRDFAKVVKIGETIAGITPGETPPPRPARPTPQRVPPPELEVVGLWEAAQPVSSDTAAVAWLESRKLDVTRVEERTLARVLPRNLRLPRWAHGPAGAWNTSGHALVTPTYDERGEIVSLHARRISGDDERKTLWPAGYRAIGIFADPLGRRLLRDGCAPTWWSRPRLMIAEGLSDYLILACLHGDDADAPAVLGIASGTWTDAIAERIPTGVCVELACDADDAGTRYNDEIARTLEGRCEVWELEVGHGA